jgi:cytochrome c553
MTSFPSRMTGEVGVAARCVLASALTLLLGAAGPAVAESAKVDEFVERAMQLTPDLASGRRLYFGCAICHTPEGWGSPDGHYPQIAGQHATVVMKQLEDIHKGNRDNPTMIPFTRSLMNGDPQRLADIAEYIEQLKMVPNNSVGPGAQLERARVLYDDNCRKCHGENGEGDAREFNPLIQGQHFEYVQRQMLWIKNGKRRNADRKMTEQLTEFTYEDLAIVADYVSRMKPDPRKVADHKDWRNPDFRPGFRTVPRQR